MNRLLVHALVWAVGALAAAAAPAAGAVTDLGTPPSKCPESCWGRDFGPDFMDDTWVADVMVSPHVVNSGDTYTVTVVNKGGDGIWWNLCGAQRSSCTFTAGAPTGGWARVGVGFSTPLGGAAEQDYFAVLADGERAIEGRVTAVDPLDPAGTVPAAGAVVHAQGAGGGYSATTNAQGRYAMVVAPGSYIVRAADADFCVAPVGDGCTRTRTVTASAHGVDFQERSWAAIRGSVSDAAGKPVPGATIAAGGRTATSNHAGRYELRLPRSLTPVGLTAGAGDLEPVKGADCPAPVERACSVVPDRDRRIDWKPAVHDLSGRILDGDERPVRDVEILVEGPEQHRVKTGADGRYELEGLREGDYTVTPQPDDGRYQPREEKSCKVVARLPVSCRVVLDGDEEADFLKGVLLEMKTKMGRRVRSPLSPALIKAGTAFSVRVQLKNLSQKELLVDPIYGQLEGNAYDGHLQDKDLPIQMGAALEPEDAVVPSPYILLEPGETRVYDTVVRTTASDATGGAGFMDADPANGGVTGSTGAGGTRAHVRYAAPAVALVREDHSLADLEPEQVLLAEDSREHRIHIDDSAPEPMPRDWLVASWDISRGLVCGVYEATAGTLRGMFVDLPKLVLVDVPSMQIMTLQYLADMWMITRDDPALRERMLADIVARSQVAFREAPWLLAKKGGDLWTAVNRDTERRYTLMMNSWYAGDWRAASAALAQDAGKHSADVVIGSVGPGMLARSRYVSGALAAVKTERYAKAAADLRKAMPTIVKAYDALAEARRAVPSGYRFAPDEVAVTHGIGARHTKVLTNATEEFDVKILLRDRKHAAIRKHENGALTKPSEFPAKAIDGIDIDFLGFGKGRDGALATRLPDSLPSVETVKRRLRAKGHAPASPVWKEALQRRSKRLKEAKTELARYEAWEKKGFVETEFNWRSQGIDRPTEYQRYRFKLQKIGSERVPMVWNKQRNKWVEIVSDIDIAAITNLDGTAPSKSKLAKVLTYLRKELDIQHGDTGSWSHGDSNKIDDLLTNKGKPLAEFAPDGGIRAAYFDRRLSQFVNSWKFRLWVRGGWLYPRAKAAAERNEDQRGKRVQQRAKRPPRGRPATRRTPRARGEARASGSAALALR